MNFETKNRGLFQVNTSTGTLLELSKITHNLSQDNW
jgi:hypothetical protein